MPEQDISRVNFDRAHERAHEFTPKERNILYASFDDEQYAHIHTVVSKNRPGYRESFYHDRICKDVGAIYFGSMPHHNSFNGEVLFQMLSSFGMTLDLLVIDGALIAGRNQQLTPKDIRQSGLTDAKILAMPVYPHHARYDLDNEDSADFAIDFPTDPYTVVAAYDAIFTGKPQPQSSTMCTEENLCIFGERGNRQQLFFNHPRYELKDGLLVPRAIR